VALSRESVPISRGLGVSLTPAPKHAVLKNLTVRPELRWDFSDQPAFGGGRKNQLTAGFDVIFKF
jgi:hypothetical protein